MAKPPMKYQVYGLKENYIGIGKFNFKIVISPRFKSGSDFSVSILNSDRRDLKFETQYWGRKLNIEFTVDKNTPDGLALATVKRSGEKIGEFNFWIIK